MKVFIRRMLLGLSLIGIILTAYLILFYKPVKDSQYTISQLAKSSNKTETDGSKTQSIDEDRKKDTVYLVGGIAIPSINRTLKIYDYSEQADYFLTNGTMLDVPNRKMGIDNVVLASHDYSETFGPLINVSVGDMIYTTDELLIYSFEVVEVFQATDNNVKDIKKVREEKEQPTITLYTCFGGSGTNQRTVVQGILKEVNSVDSNIEKVRHLFIY